MRAEIIRFLLVGLLNAAFGYGCFGLMVYAGVNRHLALLIATGLGVLFNYKTAAALVFQTPGKRRIFRFVLAYSIVYIINVVGIDVLMWLGLSVYLAAALLLGPCAAIGFLIQKYYVFRHA